MVTLLAPSRQVWPELARRCPDCQVINDTGRICPACVDGIYRARDLWCERHGPTFPGGCDACQREASA